MNKNKMSQEDFEQMERYLNDKMSTDELLAYKVLLSKDAILKEKVEDFRVMIQAVEEDSLKKKMEKIHQENFSNTSKNSTNNISEKSHGKVVSMNRNRSLFQKLAVAASIAVLIGIGAYFFSNQGSPNEKLYAEYFTPDPGLVTPMSATDDYEFYRGMVDYKQAKYELAIIRWENLLQAQPQNDTLNYFIGLSKMALGKTYEAVSNLEYVVNDSDNVFYNDATYYLGLAQLKNKENKKAIANFKKSKNEKAKNILHRLNP